MPHICKPFNRVCLDCVAEQVWAKKEDKTYYTRDIVPTNATNGVYDDTYSTNFLTRTEETSLRSKYFVQK